MEGASIPECRICYEPEEQTNKLLQPCKCSGTMGFVHLECWTKSKCYCVACKYPDETIYSTRLLEMLHKGVSVTVTTETPLSSANLTIKDLIEMRMYFLLTLPLELLQFGRTYVHYNDVMFGTPLRTYLVYAWWMIASLCFCRDIYFFCKGFIGTTIRLLRERRQQALIVNEQVADNGVHND